MLNSELSSALERTSKDYTLASDAYSEALTKFLKAQTEYDILFAKNSVKRKVDYPKESAVDRKQEIIVLMEKEKIALTMLEATSEAAKATVKKVETNKQLVREQCGLAEAEGYATGQDSVSPRFK